VCTAGKYIHTSNKVITFLTPLLESSLVSSFAKQV